MKKITLFLQLLLCVGVFALHSPLCDEKCDCSVKSDGLFFNCTSLPLTINIFNANWYFNTSTNATYEIHRLTYAQRLIVELNDTFPRSDLKILDLSSTAIFHIKDGAFRNLQNMTELILSCNELGFIHPNAFKGLRLDGEDYPLRNLKTLRLDHNKMHTLDSDIFQHIDRELEILYLDGNPFIEIDLPTQQAINSIVYLKELYLSDTGLTTLPDNFLYTPRFLKLLDLSNNNITSIASLDLEHSHNLTTLLLNGNRIVNLTKENAFPRVNTLKVLHLCKMPALSVVGNYSLGNLDALEELHMAENENLTTIGEQALTRKDIDSGAPVVQMLKKLYIQSNKLTHLNLQVSWDDLIDFDIRNNPWTCEEENQWIVDTLIPIYNKTHHKEAQEVKCAAPVEMEGRTFYELNQKKYIMRPLDAYGNRPERDGVILVCLLLGLLIGIAAILGILYSRQRHWYGLFDNSPAAFSRQYYARTRGKEEELN